MLVEKIWRQRVLTHGHSLKAFFAHTVSKSKQKALVKQKKIPSDDIASFGLKNASSTFKRWDISRSQWDQEEHIGRLLEDTWHQQVTTAPTNDSTSPPNVAKEVDNSEGGVRRVVANPPAVVPSTQSVDAPFSEHDLRKGWDREEEEGWEYDAEADALYDTHIPDIRQRKVFIDDLQLYKPIKVLNAQQVVKALQNAVENPKQNDREFWYTLILRIEHISQSLTASQILSVLISLYEVQFTPPRLFRKLSEECLAHLTVFTINDLSHLARVYSSSKTKDEGLLNVFAFVFCDRVNRNEEKPNMDAVLRYLRAFATANYYISGFMDCLLPYLLKEMHTYPVESLLHVLESLSQFRRLSEREGVCIASILEFLMQAAAPSSFVLPETPLFTDASLRMSHWSLENLFACTRVLFKLPAELFPLSSLRRAHLHEFTKRCLMGIASKLGAHTLYIEELFLLLLFHDYYSVSSTSTQLLQLPIPAPPQPFVSIGFSSSQNPLMTHPMITNSDLHTSTLLCSPLENSAAVLFLNSKSDVSHFKRFIKSSPESPALNASFPLSYAPFLSYKSTPIQTVLPIEKTEWATIHWWDLLKALNAFSSPLHLQTSEDTSDASFAFNMLAAVLITNLALHSPACTISECTKMLSVFSKYAAASNGPIALAILLFLAYSRGLERVHQTPINSHEQQRLYSTLSLEISLLSNNLAKWTLLPSICFYEALSYKELLNWAILRWLYSLVQFVREGSRILEERSDSGSLLELEPLLSLCVFSIETIASTFPREDASEIAEKEEVKTLLDSMKEQLFCDVRKLFRLMDHQIDGSTDTEGLLRLLKTLNNSLLLQNPLLDSQSGYFVEPVPYSSLSRLAERLMQLSATYPADVVLSIEKEIATYYTLVEGRLTLSSCDTQVYEAFKRWQKARV